MESNGCTNYFNEPVSAYKTGRKWRVMGVLTTLMSLESIGIQNRKKVESNGCTNYFNESVSAYKTGRKWRVMGVLTTLMSLYRHTKQEESGE